MAECWGGGGGGDPEHFDILVISWQFEYFWANNWQGINNSHMKNYKIMIQWKKKIHLIFTTYQNYPLALRPLPCLGTLFYDQNVKLSCRFLNHTSQVHLVGYVHSIWEIAWMPL